MKQKSSSNFAIRQFVPNDTNRVIFIWEQCDLVRNWNNPNFDIQRKLISKKVPLCINIYHGPPNGGIPSAINP